MERLKNVEDCLGIQEVDGNCLVTTHGGTYTVSKQPGKMLCTCPDFESTFMPCKHALKIITTKEEYHWSKLPKEYTTSEYFILDCNPEQKEPTSPIDHTPKSDLYTFVKAQVNTKTNSIKGSNIRRKLRQLECISFDTTDNKKLEELDNCLGHLIETFKVKRLKKGRIGNKLQNQGIFKRKVGLPSIPMKINHAAKARTRKRILKQGNIYEIFLLCLNGLSVHNMFA